jgi:hypothetical protein
MGPESVVGVRHSREALGRCSLLREGSVSTILDPSADLVGPPDHERLGRHDDELAGRRSSGAEDRVRNGRKVRDRGMFAEELTEGTIVFDVISCHLLGSEPGSDPGGDDERAPKHLNKGEV